MTAALELARLVGELYTDCLGNLDESVTDAYRQRINTLMANLAAETAERERLWAVVAALSGVAGTAIGACEASADSSEEVGTDTVSRLRVLYDRAMNFAGVVPLSTAGGGK